MGKPRPPRATWDVRAADVLAGRVAVDPGDLIDLIHEVNPTGRGRGAEETAARYAVKSRLQSLLVLRFAADLEVQPDPRDPAVAALRHRYRRHDACHAVIADLDDEARSWVQREIDLAGPAPDAAPPAAASSPGRRAPPPEAGAGDDEDRSVAELLAAGEEAQAAYDYEVAERCFSRAVSASGGAPGAARAFLAFAVDTLAADADALAVERRLPAATLADPGVALLLAVAAARSGDEDRALRHLAHTREPRAAEVLAMLARRAIDAGDADRAQKLVREAEGRDPAHPELRGLADGIAAIRAGERAPREAALAALVAAGRDAEALAEGSAILARWPESEVARRTVRQMEERRRAGEGRALLAAAEEAARRGETAVALELVHRALACPLAPAERQAALARVTEIEAALERREAGKRVEQVAALLADPDRARGLAAYAELDEPLRAEVRALRPLPLLEWMDRMPGGRIRAAVEAALALERAASLADRDLAGAAALVAAHERLLEDVPLARSIEQRARAAAAEDQRRRAIAALHEAEEALAGDHFGRARELLDRLDPRALPEAERARVATVAAGAAAAEERHRLIRRFERLRAAILAAARAAAGELAARGGGAERERWTREAEAIADQVRIRYGVKVEAQEGGGELLHNVGFSRWDPTAPVAIDDGGREMCVCTVLHAWMFLRFFDVGTGRVSRSVQIALDETMYDPSVVFHDPFVTVVGASGVFEFTLPGFEIARRFHRNWSSDLGPCFMDGILPAGSRMLWGRYDDMNSVAVARGVDVEGELGGKTFPDADAIGSVVGAKEPRLWVVRTKGEWDDDEHYPIVFHDASGGHLGRLDAHLKPHDIVAHPSGAGMVVVGLVSDDNGVNRLVVREISDRLEVTASHVLDADVGYMARPRMVPSLEAGMVFVRVQHKESEHVLVALRSDGRGAPARVGGAETPPNPPMVEAYRCRVPARARLGHDTSGRRAFALVDHAGGIQVVELGPDPPALVDGGPVHEAVDPFKMRTWCMLSSKENSEAMRRYVALRKLAPDARAAEIDRLEAAAGDDLQARLSLVQSMVHASWTEDAERLSARMEAQSPGDPRVLMARFALLAARYDFAELASALDAAGPERFSGQLFDHFHHLSALCRATLGDLDEARRHLALAEASMVPISNCMLPVKQLRDALDALAPPVTAEDLALDRPTVRQMIAVLRAADERIAALDPAGAVAILDRPLIWDVAEAQSLARLAAAYLDLPSPTPGDRLRKAMALATFVGSVASGRAGDRVEMLAPGTAYDEDRIAALKTAATAWLTADQGVPLAPTWLED